jgi:hypothetical protein
MGLYMLSFLALAIFIIVTPQFIASQCESGGESEYEITFQAGSALLCKPEC